MGSDERFVPFGDARAALQDIKVLFSRYEALEKRIGALDHRFADLESVQAQLDAKVDAVVALLDNLNSPPPFKHNGHQHKPWAIALTG